ncbi:MAG TPA: nitrilase-related carbon-nitrogen hydrolase, partial [Polyangiaceae bacterium]|nr:nitrilase-related carbon-nitrogen hydrolase [Polyangiaceae bacterium]
RLGVVLIGGGMPERSDDPARPYNTSVVIGRGGELLGSYRKVHLFDVDLPDGTQLTESAGNSAGGEVAVVDVLGLRVGLSICYDLRFPELFAQERELGAQLLTLPAAFTATTGAAHWHVLLRARAIETQCYLLAAAQWGEHPRGRRTYGHSLVIDPWGVVLDERAEGLGFVCADVAPERVEQVRSSMPLAAHRRLGRPC